MIARITGELVELDSQTNTVMIELGSLCYEIMVPGYCVSDLSDNLGREITLYCLEYYESSGGFGASNLIPRLIGFPHASDKGFFQKFITVKGIGIRKALRSMANPPAEIAWFIEQCDARALSGLPEIGKRTAEQVIAELKGKVAGYAQAGISKPGRVQKPLNTIEREALEVLLQLGERRSEAEELITRLTAASGDIKTTDELVQAFYRAKAGVV